MAGAASAPPAAPAQPSSRTVPLASRLSSSASAQAAAAAAAESDLGVTLPMVLVELIVGLSRPHMYWSLYDPLIWASVESADALPPEPPASDFHVEDAQSFPDDAVSFQQLIGDRTPTALLGVDPGVPLPIDRVYSTFPRGVWRTVIADPLLTRGACYVVDIRVGGEMLGTGGILASFGIVGLDGGDSAAKIPTAADGWRDARDLLDKSLTTRRLHVALRCNSLTKTTTLASSFSKPVYKRNGANVKTHNSAAGPGDTVTMVIDFARARGAPAVAFGVNGDPVRFTPEERREDLAAVSRSTFEEVDTVSSMAVAAMLWNQGASIELCGFDSARAVPKAFSKWSFVHLGPQRRDTN